MLRGDSRNLSIYNIIRWFAGLPGQMTRRPRVWSSKYHIFFIISCKICCKNGFNLKFTKIRIKGFECPKSIGNYKKKIILGTSDAWSTIHLSQQTSVLYCRLSDFSTKGSYKSILITPFQFRINLERNGSNLFLKTF